MVTSLCIHRADYYFSKTALETCACVKTMRSGLHITTFINNKDEKKSAEVGHLAII